MQTQPVEHATRSPRFSRRCLAAALGAALGAGLAMLLRASGRPPAASAPLRPPGARDEDEFLAACIRCGQCVEACPFDTLQLALTPRAGLAYGTPHVNARKVPCYLCQGYDELLCIASCPTGALLPVEELAAIRMGIAVIDESICLAYNQTICRSCWHACPFPNRAIAFDERLRPVVKDEACIGCGICEYACPTEPSSITVTPAAGAERSGPRMAAETGL